MTQRDHTLAAMRHGGREAYQAGCCCTDCLQWGRAFGPGGSHEIPPRCTPEGIEKLLAALRVYLMDVGGHSGDGVSKDQRLAQALKILLTYPQDTYYLEDEAFIAHVWEACD